MTIHPHVAHRAQEEIDEITGGPNVRLPSSEDRKHMPYVECVIKEVLRCDLVFPDLCVCCER